MYVKTKQNMKFNNETIREAVNEWLLNEESAETKYGHISNWDTSEVTDMSKLFLSAHTFNQPLNNWDVSKVKSMHAMFDNAHIFNQSLNNWDVSNVTDMSNMFAIAESFNLPIGNWDVSNVIDMSGMFALAESFNQPIGNWDVSKVSNMGGMFIEAKSFNQPIGNWNVSNVNDMSRMFSIAESFNQPIGNWDVSNVTNIDSMFDNAESFNQSLEKWKLKKLEAPELKFDFDINQWLTNNSSIKITDEFKLNNSENEFILIDYKFNGGDDFNFNIFNNEIFEDEGYVGSPSSSELTIKVNNTLIYVKHFEIEDGPIKEGVYLGVSLGPGFKNIEWYEYDFGCGRNSDLIDIIGILSVGLRDEDFVSHYDEFDYYEEFSKIELNIQIDVKKLKEKWLEYIG